VSDEKPAKRFGFQLDGDPRLPDIPPGGVDLRGSTVKELLLRDLGVPYSAVVAYRCNIREKRRPCRNLLATLYVTDKGAVYLEARAGFYRHTPFGMMVSGPRSSWLLWALSDIGDSVLGWCNEHDRQFTLHKSLLVRDANLNLRVAQPRSITLAPD
jgi:hypothetical protein